MTSTENQFNSTDPDLLIRLRSLKERDLRSFTTNLLSPIYSSDMKVIEEVILRDVYWARRFVKPGSFWIDIGANIGTFAIQVLRFGGRPYCFEPHPECFHRLMMLPVDHNSKQLAVSDHEGESDLYVENNNNWRHTLYPVRGRQHIKVETFDAANLPRCDGMKIDAEGSEIDIIYRLRHFPDHLVFEYDGGRHPKKVTYDTLIDYLKTKYDTVNHVYLKGDINFFPNGLIVRCTDKKK